MKKSFKLLAALFLMHGSLLASTSHFEQTIEVFKASKLNDIDAALYMSYTKCLILMDEIKNTTSKMQKRMLLSQLSIERTCLIETFEAVISEINKKIEKKENKKAKRLAQIAEAERQAAAQISSSGNASQSDDEDEDLGCSDCDDCRRDIERRDEKIKDLQEVRAQLEAVLETVKSFPKGA